VRHAESPVNVSQTLSCRRVDPPLTEAGAIQSEQAAAWLTDKPIRRLYTSPMRRAVQTAQIIGRRLGLECVAAEELREIDCGVLEGRSDPEAWRAFQEVIVRWLSGNHDAACEGGETGHQAIERFARFVRDLPDGEGDTLIVGHGGIVAIGLFALCPDLPVKSPHDLYLPNTGMVLVDRTPAGLSCLKWGLSEHLDRPSVVDVPDELFK